MKKLILMMFLLAFAGVFTAAAQGKKVLWDFRTNDGLSEQKLSKAESSAVFKYLLGESWDGELEITNRVYGSFTKSGVKETLYYIDGCEEDGEFKSTANCAHVNWHNAGRIAIYDGTKPVAKISEGIGYGIGKVTDLNGDGINELFALNGWGGQGITITNAEFGMIEGKKFRSLKSFQGYVDNCGNDRGAMSRVAAVINYGASVAGKMPVFSMEYYQAKCSGAWKKITKRQFDTFVKRYA